MAGERVDRTRAGHWIVAGALLGMVAGIAFALFEMVAAWSIGDGFWMPLRMIGAIVLGKDALEPSYSLGEAAATGAAVHMALSGLFGLVFGGIASLLRGRGAIVAAGTGYGLALWLVNFYVIASFAFEWFQDANPWVQFVAHTFVFGALLGIMLAAAVRTRPVPAFDAAAADEPLAADRPLADEKDVVRPRVRERI